MEIFASITVALILFIRLSNQTFGHNILGIFTSLK